MDLQRVRVAIDDSIVGETLAAIEGSRTLALSGRIPRPLIDSPKCPRCSLVGICLPDETVLVESLPEFTATPQLSLFDGDEHLNGVSGQTDDAVRRLVPARDDLRPLYVTGHGLIIGKSGDVLQIKERKQPIKEVRVGEISQVNVFGNVQFSAAALQGLCWAEKPVAHFSYGGWF